MTRTFAEIIADEIHAAGWSYGHTAYRDKKTETTVYVADAHTRAISGVWRGGRRS